MIEIRQPLPGDADKLGRRLRAADEAEVRAAGFDPAEAISMSFGNSHEAWVALEDGMIIAAWGYSAQGLYSETEAWLLTAPEIERHRRLFLRLNHDFLSQVLENHGAVTCQVHIEYTKAIRWLAWLGFRPAGKVYYNGAEFCEMRLRRH